ncbi:hypothetical protein PMAYCL1PPCAC_14005, partial [Pristionchus mayeri]
RGDLPPMLEPKYEATELPLSSLDGNKMEPKEEELKEEDSLTGNADNEVGGRDTLADDPVDKQGRPSYSNESNDSMVNEVIESEGEKGEELDEANLSKDNAIGDLDSMADDPIENEGEEKETSDGVPDMTKNSSEIVEVEKRR